MKKRLQNKKPVTFRLEQEFNAQVIVTAPSVPYKIKLKDLGNILTLQISVIILTLQAPRRELDKS